MTITFISLYPSALRCHSSSLQKSCSWIGSKSISTQCTSFRGACINRRALQHFVRRANVHSTPKAILGGGGFLGVGPSEVVVIVAVGWLLLGPQKMVQLAKDSGKLLGQLRRTADEAQDTFREAIDMELLAETEELLTGTPSKKFETRTKPGEDEAAIADTADAVREAIGTNGAHADADDIVSPQVETPVKGEDQEQSPFLDQLKRVSDPNQVAPSEVPDLDVDLDTELELQKLEKEYLEARARLKKTKNVQEVDKGIGELRREGDQ